MPLRQRGFAAFNASTDCVGGAVAYHPFVHTMPDATERQNDQARPAALELVAVFAVLAVLTACEVLATHTEILVTHPMWLDECVSALLATDPSVTHMMSAIRGGVDTNAPAFHMVAWAIVRVFRGLETAGLRIVTASAMLLALTGTYAICRCYVDRVRSALGTLAVAAHPAVVVQTWQFRGYGIWLAAAAWFCFYVISVRRRPSGWGTHLAGVLLAVLLVSTHYFGILVLFLVGVAVVATGRRPQERDLGLPLSFAAGAVALLLALPLIVSQRAILTIPTWVDDVTTKGILRALRQLFVVPSTLLVLALLALRALNPARLRASVQRDLQPLAPALSLVLFPLVLIGLSLTLQPVLVERYLLPTVLGIGVATALVSLPTTDRLGVASALVSAIALVTITSLEMKGLTRVNRETDERTKRLVALADQGVFNTERPVVFARRFELYPVIRARPHLVRSAVLLDPSGNDHLLMKRSIFERDLARVVPRFYPQYRLVRPAMLHNQPFTVITNPAEEAELRQLLPGFRTSRHGPDQYLATWDTPE